MLHAGPERGIAGSFEDGEHWQSLQLNPPATSVRDIDVHGNDVVIATHGRAFWIMDDITPLEQLTPDVTAADAHLFPPRPAYRFRPVANNVGPTDDQTAGRNPPYGASINYWLKAPAAGGVSLTIQDASGQTVRTLHGPGQAGLNRVWWDLRDRSTAEVVMRVHPEYAPWVDVGDDGRPMPGVARISILQPPGTYTVKLRAGSQDYSQPLTVLKDPNTTGTAQDIQQQVDLALAIRAEMDSVVGLINRIEWLRKQLEDLGVQLADSSTAKDDSVARRLAQAGRDLEAKLIAVEGDLFDVHLTGAREDAFRNPTQLYGRLSALLSDVAENGADFPPTSQQQQVNDVLQQRLGAAAEAFRTVLQSDVPAFRSQLRAARLPDVLAGNP